MIYLSNKYLVHLYFMCQHLTHDIYIYIVYNFLCHDSCESSHELKFRISNQKSSHELTTILYSIIVL